MQVHAFKILAFAMLLSMPAFSQPSPANDAGRKQGPADRMAEQKQAIDKFAFMDGVWRGTATHVMPDGTRHVVTQTERIGPLLGGSIKLIEGRGYNADGSTGFNAFAVLGWDVDKQAYTFGTHAMGYGGNMKFEPAADGFIWEVPAGPAMVVRYTATVKDGRWHEVGDRILPGGKAIRFFEMNLVRIGDSDWPTAGAIPPR